MTRFRYQTGDINHDVEVESVEGALRVKVGENSYRVTPIKTTDESVAFKMDGRSIEVYVASSDASEPRQFWFNGETWIVQPSELGKGRRRMQSPPQSGALTATMPGQVREVLVTVGDVVEKGALLVIMEAMKMEMRVSAPEGGIVEAINCNEGDVVERGQTLVVLA